MFAELFVLLYLGHLAADYPGQTDRQAARKAGWTEGEDDPDPGRYHHGWGANLTHAGTHITACGIALAAGWWALGWQLHQIQAAVALAWIGGTHSLIDRRRLVAWWMRNTGQRAYLAAGGSQHVDQTAHLLALGIAAAFLAGGAS